MASLENLSDEQIRNLASVAKDLSDDPKLRRQFQRLIKEKKPETIFPELEVEDRVAEVSSKVASETEALRAEITNQNLALQRRELKVSLQEKYPGISFEDIEKTMVDHAIGKHESAAQFLSNQRMLSEPSPEVPGRGGPMMMPQEAKQFFKSPTRTANRLAHEVITDLMNKRARNRVSA